MIKRILGEADPETLEDKPNADDNSQNASNGEDTDLDSREDFQDGVHDSEIDELANLWTAGNKSEVVHRFFTMDNETSVKLVFAIGLEGALEMARTVDQIIKSDKKEPSTEPEESTAPEEEASEADIDPTIGKITGREAELEEVP
jgi:hypothetical protein